MDAAPSDRAFAEVADRLALWQAVRLNVLNPSGRFGGKSRASWPVMPALEGQMVERYGAAAQHLRHSS